MSPHQHSRRRRGTFPAASAVATVVVATVAVAAVVVALAGAGDAVAAPAELGEAPARACAPDTLTGDIAFSVPSGTFSRTRSVSLRSCVAATEIRYTTDGTLPTATAARYTGKPVRIAATTRLRAQAFAGGQAVGRPGTALYVASSVTTRHDVPVVVMDDFNAGAPDREYTDAAIMAFEPKRGTARLTDAPALVSRAMIKIHGQSSTEWPKPGYRVELRDNTDKDAKLPLLGMPAESDWVLRASYLDKSFIRDPLAFTLGPAMGHLTAPRYRFAEVYLNTDGDTLTSSDYWGLYLVEETIKVSKNRTNIAKLKKGDLTSPAIEGGYIIKFEEGVSKEPRLTCTGPEGTCWRDLEVCEPDDIQPEQTAWINDYVQRFHDALHSANPGDPAEGYSAWIDVPSFVDHTIMTELSRNLDGYVRSTFFTKDRGGKLTAGPLWDYDLSWGIGGDGGNALDNLSISGWHHETLTPHFKVNDWFQRLIADPAFATRLKARWQELRKGVLSDAALTERMNTLATGLDAAAARNFTRWPNLNTDWIVNWARTPATTTWREQIDYTADWTKRRAAWLDTQWR